MRHLPSPTAMARLLISCCLFIGFTATATSRSARVSATMVSATALAKDLALVEETYRTLHPGLFRYLDEAALKQALAQLKKDWSRDQSLAEAYIHLSRFTAKIRCGHTYANFWNQKKEVQAELFDQVDKLPFAFTLIDQRMIITKTAVDGLKRGDEINAIDGHSIKQILGELLPLIKADGANDAKRRHDLHVTGEGRFEPFDVYFPLIYPPANGRYNLTLADGTKREVNCVTRKTRYDALVQRH